MKKGEPRPVLRRNRGRRSLEVVHDDLHAVRLEVFRDELLVQRMNLIGFLCCLALKLDTQRDLIALLHHGSMTWRHAAHVEIHNARHIAEVFVRASNEVIGGTWLAWIGPENNDMRKHSGRFYGSGMRAWTVK